jgi:oligoribonuclease
MDKQRIILLWLHLETEGLDPSADRILEVAWKFTNQKLQAISHTKSEVVWWDSYALDTKRWHEVVLEMHTESGLLKALDQKSMCVTLDVIEQAIINQMRSIAEQDKAGGPTTIFQLAGASVHFDKSFLKVDMPDLHEMLHHRVFDTSTLKTFFESIGMNHDIMNQGQHRAANDLRECLEVARQYRARVRAQAAVSAAASTTNP